jgi:hypothetical protein
MIDKLLKSLEGERNKLWAEARLKGLAHETPERERIRDLDEQIRAHKIAARTPTQTQR